MTGVRHATLWGFILTVISCIAFATAAPIAKTMFAAGWSAGPVTVARLAGCSLLLLIPTVVMMRGQWAQVWAHKRSIIVYGIVSMAGVQLLFFMAVERLRPSIALLLEMTAPLLIVFFLWARSRATPPVWTFMGMVLSMAGLVVVLDPRGASLDPLGVMYAMGAAACLAAFFVLSAKTDHGIPTIPLLGMGMGVGAIVVAIVCAVGLLPFEITALPITVASFTLPWWGGLVAIVAVTAIAYTMGVLGIRLIGATVSSFLNLIEVPVSVIASWWMLGDLPAVIQLLGGLVVLAGVVFVKIGDTVQERREREIIVRQEVNPETGQLEQVVEGYEEPPLPTGSLALVAESEPGHPLDPETQRAMGEAAPGAPEAPATTAELPQVAQQES